MDLKKIVTESLQGLFKAVSSGGNNKDANYKPVIEHGWPDGYKNNL